MPTSKDLLRWIIFGVDRRPREVVRTSGVDVTRVVFLSMTWMCGVVRVPSSLDHLFNEATLF